MAFNATALPVCLPSKRAPRRSCTNFMTAEHVSGDRRGMAIRRQHPFDALEESDHYETEDFAACAVSRISSGTGHCCGTET
jgi:hypothetical protein